MLRLFKNKPLWVVIVLGIIVAVSVYGTMRGRISWLYGVIDSLYQQRDSLVQIDEQRYQAIIGMEKKIQYDKECIENLVGTLEGWKKITGVYHPWEWEGVAKDTVFIDSAGEKLVLVTFEHDTGSLHIKGWTTWPPPQYGLRIELDPLQLQIGVERLPTGLGVAHLWVSDPQFQLIDVELTEVGKVPMRDWFGWLLGLRADTYDIKDWASYEYALQGGVRAWNWYGILGYGVREVDDKLEDYVSFGVLKEF